MDQTRKVIEELLEDYSMDTSFLNLSQLAIAFASFLESQGFRKKEGKFEKLPKFFFDKVNNKLKFWNTPNYFYSHSFEIQCRSGVYR